MKSSVLQAILDRRSIRDYRPEQITGEQLQALISAALASPSAMDRQPWHFTVVQNPEILAQISRASIEEQKRTADEETLQKLNQPDADIYFHAPTVFFISCSPSSSFWCYLDCGIAAENIALAAQGIGLGSVILGSPNEAFVEPQAEKLRKLLKLPQGHEVVLSVGVGVPQENPPAHVVKEGRYHIL